MRRIMMSGLWGILLLSSSCTGGLNNTGKRPNLLVIHTDEQSFRSISCYENSWPDIHTPNIDLLAKNGARFDKFYTNHPVCSPSRAALLSGHYSHKVGTYMNDIPINSDVITIGDILKQEGYETGYSGKLHLVGAKYPGLSPERNLGFDDNRHMFNNGHMKKLYVDETGQLQSPGGIGDENSYTTDFLTDRTIEFIEENHHNDWCYIVSIPDPHDPNTERPPYDTMYKPEEMMIPPTFQLPQGTIVAWEPGLISKDKGEKTDNAFLKEHKAMYYGMVKHIDDCVGKIVKHLDENGILENTIIVFTTDHGDMMGEFSRYDKGVFYEASARIPFVLHYPPKIMPNTVVSQVVSNIDFVSTLLDLMEVQYEDDSFDGRSAASLLSGKRDTDWKNTAFLSMPEDVAIVTERYKLILRNGGEPWLFDLVNDPDELENAIDKVENQETVKKLALQLRNYLENNNDPNWTDSLSYFYECRYNMHRKYREPKIQRAQKREIYWRNELDNQITSLLN